jgi:rubredoxin
MEKWECMACGYVYDPAKGDPTQNVPPGTPFEKLPAGLDVPGLRSGKRYVQEDGMK